MASTDAGHRKSDAFFADGLWARDDPGALVDFGYTGIHKTAVAAKAVIRAYYGQPARHSYFVGCSNGGRQGLMEAQRYPADFDGIVAGSPTIDDVETNTFYHAWNVRVNSTADGHAILTSDKIPALHQAVLDACGHRDGGLGDVVADPRGCRFDARALICRSGDAPTCLSPAQAVAADRIWQGPVDQRGRHLTPGDMPYGSELAWIGSMVLKPGQRFSFATSGDYTWSWDFPQYMARFDGPTGITNRNIRFTSAEFRHLTQTSPIIDSTDPDLSRFAARGGKLIMWDGWADTGSTPFGTLTYYDAAARYLGQRATDRFLKLYMIPGVYHCGGGPTPATADYLTPLMAWQERGIAPTRVVTSFAASPTDATVIRTRPAFPYPSIAKYRGTGSPDDQANWVQAPPEHHYAAHYSWLGDSHYSPQFPLWCRQEGLTMVCRRRGERG